MKVNGIKNIKFKKKRS